VPEGMQILLQNAGMTLTDVDWFIPHSANLRIIESICERSGFPMEKTLHSMEYYGNTSAATIPLALDMGLREGKVKPGDTVLIYGFGGGLVQAGLLLRI
jgi:3-oxoacyl-[acyl-carrier-protein] synthase-3